MSLTLTREQHDAIYEVVLNHLTGNLVGCVSARTITGLGPLATL
jgi:hypothetical protein